MGTARRCVGTSSGGRALRRGAPRPRGGRGPRDADRPSRHSPAPASPQTPLTHTSMAATGDSVVAAVEAAVMAAEGTPASPPRNGGLLSTHTQSSRSQVQREQGDGALHDGGAQMTLASGRTRDIGARMTTPSTPLTSVASSIQGRGKANGIALIRQGRKALSLAVAPSIVRAPPHPRSPSRGSRHI